MDIDSNTSLPRMAIAYCFVKIATITKYFHVRSTHHESTAVTRLETESLLTAAVNELANQIRAVRLQLLQIEASLKKKRKER